MWTWCLKYKAIITKTLLQIPSWRCPWWNCWRLYFSQLSRIKYIDLLHNISGPVSPLWFWGSPWREVQHLRRRPTTNCWPRTRNTDTFQRKWPGIQIVTSARFDTGIQRPKIWSCIFTRGVTRYFFFCFLKVNYY